MALAESAVSHPASIIELAAAVRRKGSVLNSLRDRQALRDSPSPSLKEIIGDLKNLRSGDLLKILKLRGLERQMRDDTRPTVEITLVRFPNEEYTEVSQNIVLFCFPNTNPLIPKMRSNLDLLAGAGSSDDSRTVLDLIGDPDVVEDEPRLAFLDRTYEEIRASERRFRKAKKIDDLDQMTRMDEIRELLIAQTLAIRGVRGNFSQIICSLDVTEKSPNIVISTSPEHWTTIKATRRLVGLVMQSGGWNSIIGATPQKAQVLLNQLG